MFYGAGPETFRKAGLLRKNMTLPEKILWKRLRNKDIYNVKFRRQHPVGIYIVDFYCHACKLVIEVDGEIHLDNKAKEYDIERSSELERFGISILRFTNYQVIFRINSVITRIKEEIAKLTPL